MTLGVPRFVANCFSSRPPPPRAAAPASLLTFARVGSSIRIESCVVERAARQRRVPRHLQWCARGVNVGEVRNAWLGPCLTMDNGETRNVHIFVYKKQNH